MISKPLETVLTSTFTIFLPFLSKIDFASRFVKKQIDTKDKM
ncbi:hypothetical protein LEP1GSC062_2715 [Leptospira alexanderi serovar Manhao 3 str. L 60]|uniref:Uncharacterized protein n=1 Tax=Leptospira alexanderi serovar Manhao 3 str. L 60 TaxID=1049759 RepID=V6I3N3_9LEPT|nr:hypothetical protein LEP1GSC062_2715 [Leptospira alexanderi serovar Manhao 3 str. L 60]